jgi:lysophospholipase L1-like esterase
MLASFDDGKTIFYLNISANFKGKDGSVSASIMPDGTHLSEAGYRIWATSMDSKLQQLLAQ